MSSRCHSAQLGRGGGPPRLLSTPHTHLPQVSENPTGWMEQEATVKTTAPRPAVPLAPAGGPPGPAAASRAGLSARSMAPPCSHSHPMIPRATEQEVVPTGRRGLGVKLLHKLRPRHCHRLDRNVTGTPRSSGPGPFTAFTVHAPGSIGPLSAACSARAGEACGVNLSRRGSRRLLLLWDFATASSARSTRRCWA